LLHFEGWVRSKATLLALAENFWPLAGHGQWAGCMVNQHGKPALKLSTCSLMFGAG